MLQHFQPTAMPTQYLQQLLLTEVPSSTVILPLERLMLLILK